MTSTPTIPPEKQGVMATTDEREARLGEDERVLAWRTERFIALGFDEQNACELAGSTVDTHDAAKLLERGCPPELAVRILR